MIKVDNIEVFNFEGAIRGMRNPMNSWHKSDSYRGCEYNRRCDDCTTRDVSCQKLTEPYVIGANDLGLMQRLYKGGSEHRKYLRQIMVCMTIEAPLYWFKEFDTYKVGTTANSTSTMHKIHAKEFDFDDFSCEHLKNETERHEQLNSIDLLRIIIKSLNYYRKLFIETKDKRYWWQMIQLLPSSYNQTRTITMNYENVMNMIHQRENHKLDEWREFVKILRSLPYVMEIRGENQ